MADDEGVLVRLTRVDELVGVGGGLSDGVCVPSGEDEDVGEGEEVTLAEGECSYGCGENPGGATFVVQ